MSETELKVPLGLDESGRLIPPHEAKKNIEQYSCPGCNSILLVKQGDHKVWHFAHKADTNCSGETILHRTGKLRIQQAIQGWRNGLHEAPRVGRKCPTCSQIIEISVPIEVTGAELEVRTASNFIVDVALTDSAGIVWAVEIMVTHAVDSNKAENLGLPFVELNAEDVISDSLYWLPITDRLSILECNDCQEQEAKRRERIRAYEIRTREFEKHYGISPSNRFYRSAITTCWKCHYEILVFSWPENVPLVEPIPASIQLRRSNTTYETYMANTCLNCNALQGDFFLYNEPDGPFFGLNRGQMSANTFEADMQDIFDHGSDAN